MLDLAGLIEQGLSIAGSGPVVLAAPFRIPEVISRHFVRSGRVSGIVAKREWSRARRRMDLDMPRRRQWAGAGHSRLIRETPPSTTLLFLGMAHQIGATTLLEAVGRGIRRIVCLRPDAEFESRAPMAWLRSHLGSIVAGGLRWRVRSGERPFTARDVSFENAYRDLLTRVDFLRLPPAAFDPDYALLMAGSLGPGGAERQLTYSARGIARSGQWRVGVAVDNLGPPVSNFYEPAVREGGAELHLVPASGGQFDDARLNELVDYFRERYGAIGFHHVLGGILDYALFLRKRRPGLLHTWMDSCNVRAGIAALLVGVPRLVLCGRSVAPDHFIIFQPYMRAGYRAILDNADPLIVNNSHAGAADYAGWLDIDADRIVVTHNGFEFPDEIGTMRREARQQLGFDESAVILGGLLRFTEEKRPALWFEVAEAFVRAHPNHSAVAFGDGPMRNELLAAAAERGLASRILMPGITRDAWASLSAFDIFLLTSRMEGLPNVLVEAQAAAVPVVAPNVGGAGETFRDGVTGFMVPHDRPDLLVRHCLALGADRQMRARMGQAGQSFARSEFGAARMIARTLALYDGALVQPADRAA